MKRFESVFCGCLVLIASYNICQAVNYEKDFSIQYREGEKVTDAELETNSLVAMIKKVENQQRFDLILEDKIEFSFFPSQTHIVEYMYGNIMILIGNASTDADLHRFFYCKFPNDDDVRTFHRALSPSHENETSVWLIKRLRFINEEKNTSEILLHKGTIFQKYIEDYEMTSFAIRGEPNSEDDNSEQAYLVIPENGFHLTEARNKEVMLFPTRRKTHKYIIHFIECSKANEFAKYMKDFTENKKLINPSDNLSWLQYFED